VGTFYEHFTDVWQVLLVAVCRRRVNRLDVHRAVQRVAEVDVTAVVRNRSLYQSDHTRRSLQPLKASPSSLIIIIIITVKNAHEKSIVILIMSDIYLSLMFQ